ncbi:unnamed protein product [Pseudo-nitzschia multistriata]|uniref:Uncharacterized protein n=1 Tax=Pseudo-nitzschia multistriata TaxID=183589 RepID=A0A448YXL4_9STRA|nr:unnamed protein product [Pseudo-nitzschia multistriata]
MTIRNRIEIVFAPLPEEERDVDRSGAKEFAHRTANQFRNSVTTSIKDGACVGEICHLVDWDKERFMESVSLRSMNNEIDEDMTGGKTSIIVFLISCGPDGSVHRNVRKTTKWFKEQQQTLQLKEKSSSKAEAVESDGIITVSIFALLGHSVCKTSAEQMADEVFSPGRRLAKAIQNCMTASQSIPTGDTRLQNFVLETQIELEPPEEKFDAWIKLWADSLKI